MARSFILATDSGTDLSAAYYSEHDLPFVSIEFTIDDKTYLDDAGKSMSIKEFYDRIRKGALPTTSMVNTQRYLDFFEELLKTGKDVYYIAFSSGLSGSHGCAVSAAAELREKYPERKLYVTDSLCASMGQGLLVHYALRLADEGKSIDEVRDWVEENKKYMNHLVTVDNLFHLYKGGRVSRSSAIVGSIIGIKPMIHLNIEGKLIPVERSRGRKAAIQRLVTWMQENSEVTEFDTVALSHSDCEEEALWVKNEVMNRFKIKEFMMNYIGPVIGGHTGVGTIALYFLGKPRYK